MTREGKKKQRKEDLENSTVHYGCCLITTTDDFYPCYDDSKVQLTWMRLSRSREERKEDKPFLYRVCVWGADDYGLELDDPDKEKVEKIYLDLIELQPISVDYLEAIGFVIA